MKPWKMTLYTFALTASALIWTGCASTHACALQLEGPQQPTAHTSVEEVDPAIWARLLLRGNAYTCSGTALPTADVRGRGIKPYAIVRPDAAGEGRHLVWLIVQRLPNRLVGPVAVVERQRNTFVARAVGSLALPPGEVALHYDYGSRAETLWATSTSCRAHAALRKPLCHQQLAVLARNEGQLVAVDRLITTHRERAVALGGGWHHVVMERTAIEIDRDRLLLAQRIDEHEIQAHRRHAPPRQQRTQTQQTSLMLPL